MRPHNAPHSETPAFDAVADRYDAQFTETAVGRMQRAVVRAFLETWKNGQAGPSPRVLELNCGTGEDALWLARKGCRVLATDISAGMTAMTENKTNRAGLEAFIQTQILDIQNIRAQTGFSTRRFDLVFSNFGGLNCVPPEALQRLGAALPELLNPGGRFIAVVMGRFCTWETIYFLGKGRFRSAFRRFLRTPVAARLDDRTKVDTWYYAPGELTNLLGSGSVSDLQAVGFWLPPSYLNPFFEKRPRLLRFLNQLERTCRGRFWARGADHFLICVRAEDARATDR